MPTLEQMDRRQDALMWRLAGVDGYGKAKVAAPVTLKVRWMWKRSEVPDGKGGTVMLDAAAVTDRLIPIGSIMWLASTSDPLAEWAALVAGTGTSFDEQQEPELCVVALMTEVPSIKARAGEVFREAGLQRWQGELPEVA